MKLPAIAGTAPFAHLLSFAKGGRSKAEDEKNRETDEAETDNLDEENGDGDDERDGPNDGKGKKGRRAENSDREEENSEQDDGGEEKSDDARGKKAKGRSARAEDDGDGEEDDEEGDDGSDGADMRRRGARSARLRERARCAAIFSDAAAGENPALAATLAFTTDMPRSQAVKVLRAGGVPKSARRTSLDERMARMSTPRVGASDAGQRSMSLADQIIAAGKRRRGEV